MDLKDQLVKAGLVSKKQARQAAHQDRVGHKRDGGATAQQEAEARALEARRQLEAEKARDLEIARANAAKQAERERELQAQGHRKSLIEGALRDGRLDDWNGPRTYYFVDGTRIESLSVSDTAARLLQEGRAAIVRTLDPRAPYILLKSGSALRLKEAAPERIVTLHSEAPAPAPHQA